MPELVLGVLLGSMGVVLSVLMIIMCLDKMKGQTNARPQTSSSAADVEQATNHEDITVYENVSAPPKVKPNDVIRQPHLNTLETPLQARTKGENKAKSTKPPVKPKPSIKKPDISQKPGPTVNQQTKANGKPPIGTQNPQNGICNDYENIDTTAMPPVQTDESAGSNSGATYAQIHFTQPKRKKKTKRIVPPTTYDTVTFNTSQKVDTDSD